MHILQIELILEALILNWYFDAWIHNLDLMDRFHA